MIFYSNITYLHNNISQNYLELIKIIPPSINGKSAEKKQIYGSHVKIIPNKLWVSYPTNNCTKKVSIHFTFNSTRINRYKVK